MRLLIILFLIIVSVAFSCAQTPDSTGGSWFDVLEELAKDTTDKKNIFDSSSESTNTQENTDTNTESTDDSTNDSSSESPISVISYGEESDIVSTEETYYEDYSDEDTTDQELFKPEIGLGSGLFTYFGDVNDGYRKNPIVGRTGRNLLITRKVNDFLTLNFHVVQGVLSGNERNDERNLNFKTDIFAGGVSASYNFLHLIKKQRTIMPFISLGIESFEFNSKGDLYDADGVYYHYWEDGSIRNIAENASNASQSVMIQRDYNYETDLRKLDADDFGKYQQVAFGIPIDFGIDIKVTNWITMRLGNAIHFTFNDLIDNVNSNGEGVRQGSAGTDKFMYTYFSFRFNLFSINKSSKDDIYDDDLFEGINGDEDGDGVLDFDDQCAGTTTGAPVDEKGCPFDKDGDGIPDMLDDEETVKDIFYVDENGVGRTEEYYLNSSVNDSIAVLAKDIKKLYPSMGGGIVKQFESFYIEIPKRFQIFDLNKDDYISPEELTQAIDMFFDFDTNLTINDMYMLNDFFFEQNSEF